MLFKSIFCIFSYFYSLFLPTELWRTQVFHNQSYIYMFHQFGFCIVQNTWQPQLEWSITLSNSSQAYDVMFYYVGFVLMSLRHDEILFIVFDVYCTFEIWFDFCNWWNRKIVPSIGIEPMTSPTLAGRSNLLSYKGHSSFTIKVAFLCFINLDFV